MTATLSRLRPGRLMSPIGASLTLRNTFSASRKNAAVSRTDRVSTPSLMIRTGMSRITLSWANRSRVGFNPTSPLTAAGIRIEPPPSLACAMGTTPAATKAPEPADDAPAVWSVFHGPRTGPSRGCSADPLKPNSESWVLPSGIRPVPRNIRAKSPSFGLGLPT